VSVWLRRRPARLSCFSAMPFTKRRRSGPSPRQRVPPRTDFAKCLRCGGGNRRARRVAFGAKGRRSRRRSTRRPSAHDVVGPIRAAPAGGSRPWFGRYAIQNGGGAAKEHSALRPNHFKIVPWADWAGERPGPTPSCVKRPSLKNRKGAPGAVEAKRLTEETAASSESQRRGDAGAGGKKTNRTRAPQKRKPKHRNNRPPVVPASRTTASGQTEITNVVGWSCADARRFIGWASMK